MNGKNAPTKDPNSDVNPVQRSISSSSISSTTSYKSQSHYLTSTSAAVSKESISADATPPISLFSGNLVFMEKQQQKGITLVQQASIGLVNISTSTFPQKDAVLKRKNSQPCTKVPMDSSGESSQDLDSIYPASTCSPPAATSAQRTNELSQAGTNMSHKSLNDQNNTFSKKRQPLRRGKWTIEEEEYVARAIKDFNNGYLKAPPGATLRSYLSEKLNCDPMRITKKFTGDACIGKRIFHPVIRCEANAAEIDKAQAELDALERRWRVRIETQQKETSRRSHRNASIRVAIPISHLEDKTSETLSGNCHGLQNKEKEAFTQAATWLERAESILTSRYSSDLETQMKQVEALIHEGPSIHTSSSILSALLGTSLLTDSLCHQSATIDSITCPTLDSGQSPQPAQSRMKEDTSKFSGKNETCKQFTADEGQCIVGNTSYVYVPAGDTQLLDLSNSSSPASGSDAEALVDFVKSLRNNSDTHTY